MYTLAHALSRALSLALSLSRTLSLALTLTHSLYISISLASKLKNVLANGNLNANVPVEGCIIETNCTHLLLSVELCGNEKSLKTLIYLLYIFPSKLACLFSTVQGRSLHSSEADRSGLQGQLLAG